MELAILDFVKNADEMKVQVRRIFDITLGSPISKFLRTHSAEKTFVTLENSGNYGKLILESEKEIAFREKVESAIDEIDFNEIPTALIKAGVKNAIHKDTEDIYIPCEEIAFFKHIKFFVIRKNGDSSSEYSKIREDKLLWSK